MTDRTGFHRALGARLIAAFAFQKTKTAIPGARLIEFPDAGHAPQISDPQRFNAPLIDALAR